jgi:MerR family transcriptional regulator/heat shock protein HspR
MFAVHQQTIRMYEKEGLISPKRSEGNTRMFSEEDVDRLEEIIYLTHKMGINLAGVEAILKLKRKVKKLQDEINKLLNTAQIDLEDESEGYKKDAREQAQRLLDIKRENLKKISQSAIDIDQVSIDASRKKSETKSRAPKESDKFVTSGKKRGRDIKSDEDWEIDYDDE